MLYDAVNPHGGDIYSQEIRLDFSVNLNPLGVPESVMKAMEESLRNIRNYPDPYCRELVRALSQVHQIPSSYVLCGNGAAELIYSYCAALRPGSAVVLYPSFTEYELALRAAAGMTQEPADRGTETKKQGTSDLRIIPYHLKEETEFRLDEEFIPFLQKEQPEVVFLCNPNNPDGRVIAPELSKRILNLCREQHIRLFLDECFIDLSDGGVSMIPKLAEYQELFILKAFTKNFALPGIRLGYAMTSDQTLLSAMARLVQPWNVSVPAQAAGVAALKETDYLQNARRIIECERNWLIQQLKECGLRVYRSEANYLLFQGPCGLDAKLLEQGIRIRSCAAIPGLREGWYRIAVRMHEDNEELIRVMKKEIKWHEIS